MKLFSPLQLKKSLAILGLLLFCQSASAGASFEELSITRVNTTFPTKLYVHAILTGVDDTQKVMFKISNSSGVKVSGTTLTIGTSKKDLAGQTYISYDTATEYTEGDSSKTFVLSADLLNSSGVSLLSKTTSFVPKNLVVGGSKVTSTTKVAPTAASSDGKTVENTIYTYLAPLPGFGTTFDIGQKDAISNYLGILFKVILGLMGVVAVFELIRAGITMMSDSFSKKSNAKDRIKDIVIALIIGLCSVLILQTINPKLVNMSFGFSSLDIKFTPIGRDEIQKPDKNGMLCAYPGFSGYKDGSPWVGSDAEIREWMKPMTAPNPVCTKVGQTNCTSLVGLDKSFLRELYNACIKKDTGCKPSDIIVSEGTACWKHAPNPIKVHYPGGWTVDLVVTPGLKSMIYSKWKKGPMLSWGQCYSMNDKGIAVVEESPGTKNAHFHAYSLTGGCSAAGQGR